ncbi:peptidase M24 [Terriglobus saanensis SP1PR4]|uniref:Peptidase M24 n=1 Tax=Terriglobus saanensis (strain ATCC BAA-1853 / DSM 23119 / SP1PR4) TaxID=401053 RepID=E8V7D6_TERSS|nr:peptidase M24 [Terriglobus saanensis SP1PR4]
MVAAMRAKGLEAMVITHPADVRWVSGFTGSNAAVALMGGRRRLFTDGRYTAQAKEEVQGLSVTIAKKPVAQEACAWLEKAGAKLCGFDAAVTSVAALEAMKQAVSGKVRRGFFRAVSGMVVRLREVKDTDEAETMRQAALLGCRVYDEMLGVIEAGMTEIEVAAELEYRARRAGAEAMSFETIVASGVRGGLPHGKASGKRLARGEMVTLDFGVILGGYCSDMTRTVYLSRSARFSHVEAEQKKTFDAVLEAQIRAVSAVRSGVSCAEVDEAAREVLRTAGLEKEFSHSTGHGVGLEIHEGPRVGAKQAQKLESGMVITIEPGVYLAGKYGVRIEDTVLVTEAGCEVLTPSVKSWMEL